MTTGYTLLGSQMSPYTMKMYAYLQFKGVPFEWEERSLLNSKKFRQHAQVALIPMLFRPDGSAVQSVLEETDCLPFFAAASSVPVPV